MASKRAYWDPPKIWTNSPVYIIGGGPSLKGMDLTPLRKKRVIGVNAAYRDYPGIIDLLWFGDRKFWSDEDPKFHGFCNHINANFTGLIATCCAGQINLPPYIKKLKRGRMYGINTDKTKSGIKLTPRTISWNGNSGASAINVACHLGAKTIILLGFDMTLGESGEKNYHDYYNGEKPGEGFGDHKKGFPEIARKADMLGIEIINANPESAIECFAKMTFEEALERY